MSMSSPHTVVDGRVDPVKHQNETELDTDNPSNFRKRNRESFLDYDCTHVAVSERNIVQQPRTATDSHHKSKYHSSFTAALVNGTSTCPGILRLRNADTHEPVCPYDHQRQAVKRVYGSHATDNALVIAHDPGLGKTFTAILAIAAGVVKKKAQVACLISVPAAVITQWLDEVQCWLLLPRNKILVIEHARDCTAGRLQLANVVLVTHTMLGMLHKASNNTIFHPPPSRHGCDGTWDLFIIDEVHMVRGLSTLQNEAHASVSARKRIGLTGTMVVNAPDDLAGISKVLRPSPVGSVDFVKLEAWKRHAANVNRNTVKLFYDAVVHRATEDLIQLPKLYQTVVSYPVRIPSEYVETYNTNISYALKLRRKTTIDGKFEKETAHELWRAINNLRQFCIWPELARVGAEQFVRTPELLNRAASAKLVTGALHYLHLQIAKMQSENHARIIIACESTAALSIASAWLSNQHPSLGTHYRYSGDMTKASRVRAKQSFLCDNKALLFLSIQAGGTGLHLVPGCECMIFWGAVPYSPAHKTQCMKRIHRIGQTAPATGKVSIVHMIPYGSVDYAVSVMHTDKTALMKYAHNPGDSSAFANDKDGVWRKCGRILDNCLALNADGNFPQPPTYNTLKDGTPNYNSPFKILSDIPPEQTSIIAP